MEKADIIFILTMLVGVGITFSSLLSLQRNSRLARNGITVEGTIIQIVYEGVSSPSYYPIVRFWTPQQELITARATYRTKFSRFQEGETVKVRFDLADPTNFIIEGEGSGVEGWLYILLGLVIILYGIIRYLHI